MKNNQVIDGVQNCRYPIYVAIKEKVRLLFPADGQDAEFIEDALARRGKRKLGDALARIWQSEVKKPDVVGIHGTFFYELDWRKKFHSTRKEAEIVFASESA